jgi:AhpD family alkylhydroperoxidase
MPRVPLHDPDSAPKASRDLLAPLHARYGRVLNIYGEMAHVPVVLAAYTGIQAAIAEHETFDARTREAIALAVAAVDGCDYCQAAHTASGRRAGLSLEETRAARVGQPVDAKLDALLAVARQAVTHLGEVDQATWQHALDADRSVEELAELFAHLIAGMFTNYFNHYVGTELDFPPAPSPA